MFTKQADFHFNFLSSEQSSKYRYVYEQNNRKLNIEKAQCLQVLFQANHQNQQLTDISIDFSEKIQYLINALDKFLNFSQQIGDQEQLNQYMQHVQKQTDLISQLLDEWLQQLLQHDPTLKELYYQNKQVLQLKKCNVINLSKNQFNIQISVSTYFDTLEIAFQDMEDFESTLASLLQQFKLSGHINVEKLSDQRKKKRIQYLESNQVKVL